MGSKNRSKKKLGLLNNRSANKTNVKVANKTSNKLKRTKRPEGSAAPKAAEEKSNAEEKIQGAGGKGKKRARENSDALPKHFIHQALNPQAPQAKFDENGERIEKKKKQKLQPNTKPNPTTNSSSIKTKKAAPSVKQLKQQGHDRHAFTKRERFQQKQQEKERRKREREQLEQKRREDKANGIVNSEDEEEELEIDDETREFIEENEKYSGFIDNLNTDELT
jgi:hypothetical protein